MLNLQILETKKLSFLASLLFFTQIAGFAQSSNDFFGSSVPSTGNPIDRPPGVAAAEQAASGGGGDFTADEKRMQKKYKANMRAAQDLIDKAEKMIKEGEKKKNDKMTKKGQVLKQVAEKHLKELKENNPMPDLIK